jgi:hypothetical protein
VHHPAGQSRCVHASTVAGQRRGPMTRRRPGGGNANAGVVTNRMSTGLSLERGARSLRSRSKRSPFWRRYGFMTIPTRAVRRCTWISNRRTIRSRRCAPPSRVFTLCWADQYRARGRAPTPPSLAFGPPMRCATAPIVTPPVNTSSPSPRSTDAPRNAASPRQRQT